MKMNDDEFKVKEKKYIKRRIFMETSMAILLTHNSDETFNKNDSSYLNINEESLR